MGPVRRSLLLALCVAGCLGEVAEMPPADGEPGVPPGQPDPPRPRPTQEPPAAACTTTDVAYFPVRRLTREQYRRVTTELLKGDSVAPEELPSDERQGNFASNARAPL